MNVTSRRIAALEAMLAARAEEEPAATWENYRTHPSNDLGDRDLFDLSQCFKLHRPPHVIVEWARLSGITTSRLRAILLPDLQAGVIIADLLRLQSWSGPHWHTWAEFEALVAERLEISAECFRGRFRELLHWMRWDAVIIETDPDCCTNCYEREHGPLASRLSDYNETAWYKRHLAEFCRLTEMAEEQREAYRASCGAVSA